MVVEYPKIEDAGTLGKVKIYYENRYKGQVEKIEDNKIYFMVDEKGKDIGEKWPLVSFKDVEDYEVVFDIDSYTLEYDPLAKDYIASKDTEGNLKFDRVYYEGDYLSCDFKNYYSAEELEFLIGKYLTASESMWEYYDRGYTNKYLSFSVKKEYE